MLNRNKVLLLKEQTAKGTPAVPTVANDLIVLSGDVNISVPTEQDMGESELKGTWGSGNSVTTKQAFELSIEARVRGLGQGVSALLVPSIDTLLKLSGHTVTSAGDGSATARSAEYVPTSVESNLKWGTGYWYEDGLRYDLEDAVCGLSFEASMSALMVKTALKSGYKVPSVQALPSWSMPDEEVFRMTSALCTVSEGGSTVNIGSFTFDTGVSPEEENETGNHSFGILDRNPTISIDPKAVATADDWNALTNCTSLAIVATFTNSLGETLVFTAPKAVAMEQSTGTRAGRLTRQRKYSLKETAGDDQYTIKWTSVL